MSFTAFRELGWRWSKEDDALVEWTGRVAGARSHTVLRFVGDDAQQPWAKRGFGSKCAECLDRLDECGLRGVLRFVTIASDDQGNAEGHVLIPPHELLEGVLVSRPGSLNKVVVDRCLASVRTAFHSLYTEGVRLVPDRARGPSIVTIAR